ncbi:MAG TPA: PKD domain-containing protein, partial [Tepidisphaeraceae bacterium]|nr:PKD domain-containing protein [Tepidisphaeraceae bacterium]
MWPPTPADVVERLESRTLLAAAPTLLRDPSFPFSFVEVGDRTFFSDGGLNVTNGTAGGTLPVLGVPAFNLARVGDRVYFTSHDGVWRSDGTTEGTVRVLPMNNNFGGVVRAGGFTELGGAVYFHADVRNVADGLWKTDGTPGGTTLVKAVPVELLTRAGDRLYFIGTDASGEELWTSDGTPDGTHIVRDINPGQSSSMFAFGAEERPMAPLGDRLLFTAWDGNGPNDLFVTDGTDAGTTRLSTNQTALPGIHGQLTPFNGAVYYSAHDAAGNQELWKSDGTAAGTALVKELGPNHATGFANRIWALTVSGDTLFFGARDGDFRCNLWKSDGTAAGTVVVEGSRTGANFSDVFNLTDVAGTLAFTAADAAVMSGAYSLWTSDGTTAGTTKVRDTFRGGMEGAYGTIGAVGSVVLFTANDGVGSQELWALQTDATPPEPQARAKGPATYSVFEGGTLRLHGYATADPLPGRPLTYAWDLDGDGAFGETGAAAPRGDETGTDPTLNAAGLDGPSTHVVRFRVSDPTGYASTDAANVTVRNVAPNLTVAGGPAVLTQGNAYTLTLTSFDPGPDTIAQWVVDWGDGVTQTLPGDTTSVTHDYGAPPGTYGISVRAVDDDGEYRAEREAARDAGFGTGGLVTSNVVERDDTPSGVAVQRDGKIVTASTLQLSASFGHHTIAVHRYNPDGTLDPTFGDGGRVVLRQFSGLFSGPVAIQPDGRILAGGNAMFRFLPDGSIDATFGSRFGHGVGAIELAPDGDIFVGGRTDTMVLGRLNPDGTLDPAYGAGGKVVTDVAANDGGVRDMALQPDGKLVVVPYGYPPTPSFLVMRFNADGSPDAAFDGDGRATVDFGYGTAVSMSVALAPGGSILVAGSSPALPTAPQPGGTDTVVARLTPAGALDTTFADGGRLRTAPVGPYNSGWPLEGMVRPIVRVLPDGRFLLGGSDNSNRATWHYVVDRYLPDGTPDATFAPGGRFRILEAGGTGPAFMRDMTVQADGAPLLYGGAGTAHNPSEVLVRLTPPGLSVRVVDAARPVVTLPAPAGVTEAATYALALSATDPDGDGVDEMIVNWGDGSVQVVPGDTTSLTHVYPDGPFSSLIKVSAIDGDGSISTAATAVTVANVPPAITVTGGPPVNEAATYTVQFGATDPGADRIAVWTVNWGDGRVQNFAGDATSAQHAYQDNGEYEVVVSATDEDGTFPAAPVVAKVANVAPTLDPIGPRVAAAGAPFRLTFTARDVVPEAFRGTIDWGDGSEPTTFTGPANPTTTSASLAVAHTYAARGAYTVTVNLSDGDGGTATRTGTVRVGDVVVSVYEDRNGNGVRDAVDVPRAGVRVYLDLDHDGVPDENEPARLTDAFGDALFDELAPATYAARLVSPADWHLSALPAGFVDLTPGTTSAAAPVGLTQVAALAGRLFNDANANGVRDEGEGPLAGQVSARRLDATNVVLSAAADATGFYRFTGVAPGQYLVEFSTPRTITAPFGRRGHYVAVTGGQAEYAGLDFGSVAAPGGLIGGTLYHDINGNG